MENFNKALDLFKSGQTGSVKKDTNTLYVATKNALVIRKFDEYHETMNEAVLAARVNGHLIGNSSMLDHKFLDNGRVSSEQLALAQVLPMIPFSVIKEAGLSLSGYQEIDKGQEETIYRKMSQWRTSEKEYFEMRHNSKIKDLVVTEVNETYGKVKVYDLEFLQGEHFAGARLFKVNDRMFLLDIDRGELDHGIINPFLVELQTTNVNTIAEAYESLKPQQVVDAIAQGLEVKRQGEWFFIPVTSELDNKRFDKAMAQIREEEEFFSGVLRAGNNRPNTVDDMVTVDGQHFVKGTVSHSGREHKDIELTTWHLAMPNTSVTSWTITGDLD